MILYSMTATFGKLEHEKLTLQPGLNVISAGNEWGKSTWCACLTAMLYGVETRAKSTRTALADKEHYAPWSGSPMAGRMDINWQGRDITVERTTRGRVPLGEFRAYETATGLAVPELTAANCGQMLLGVERSVFLRSGFIRNDLSVTDDEALRRRLNNLVTSGDENCAADRLAKGLKDLKNRIRYNRTGLLPQAEAERARLEAVCREHAQLEKLMEQTQQRLRELEQWQQSLENHSAALAHAASLEDARRIAHAENARDAAREELETMAARCDSLPERETAEEMLDALERLQGNLLALQERLRTLEAPEEPSAAPEIFRGLTGEEACARTKEDMSRHRQLSRKRWLLPILGLLLLLAGAAAAWWEPVPAAISAAAGALTVLFACIRHLLRRRERRALETYYESSDPDCWMRRAEEYAAERNLRRRNREEYLLQRRGLEGQLQALQDNIRTATRGQGLARCRAEWTAVLNAWKRYGEAMRESRRAEAHLADLKAMVRPVQPPAFPDDLTFSEEKTARLLAECRRERQHLEHLSGQYQGRQAALEPLTAALQQRNLVDARIQKLERTYDALILAQTTLMEATAQLQRRFSPRITRRAQELMAQMTGGRYDRLNLSGDLTIRAGTRQEDTLHDALWRSDGTVDQLYLALRLAVAEALLPGAPLILDDALVRFDDQRLKAAMEILKSQARSRQVIVFTCHSREKELL